MIIPLPFIVSLLFTITYATDFEYKIELDRCSVDTTCLVRQRCIADTPANLLVAGPNGEPPEAETSLVRFKEAKDKLNDKECDAVVQIKQISKIKYLILMQLTSATGELNINEGFGIVQEKAEPVARDPNASPNDPDPAPVIIHEVQIECKNTDKPSGRDNEWKLEYAGLKPLIREEKRLFCSLFLNVNQDTPTLIKTISESFKLTDYEDTAPYLKYHTSSPTEEQLYSSLNKDKLWTAEVEEQCNGELAKSEDNFADNDIMFARVDTSRMAIECSLGKMNVKFNGAPVDANKITCEQRAVNRNKVFKWILSGPSLTDPIEVDKTKSFEVSCKIPYCTQCTDLPSLSQDECPTCEQFIPKEVEGCKTLTCPDNKFTVNGKEELKSPKGITCNKKADGTIGWNLHNTDDPQPVIKASCYIFKGCKPFPKLKCPEGVECKTGPVLNTDIFNYTCPDADAVLQQNKKPVKPNCNKETHDWNGVDTNEDLYCAVDETKTDESKGDPNTGGQGLTIGIAVVLSIVGVAAVVGGAYYVLVYKKRQDAKKTTKKEEGTSKKSSKKVESKSGAVGSSNEAKKEEKKSDPNKETEKPAAEGAKDGKETPKDGVEPPKETPKDAAATPAAAAATPGAPPTPAAAAPTTPATPAADSAPAPADVTPV